MDTPGASISNMDNLCKLCNARQRAYTCPRCGIGYCSADCYKSEDHIECSESFYKQCIEEELRSQEKDPESRKRMVEILKRVREQDLIDTDLISDNLDFDKEEQEQEVDEELDSDDEEDVPDLQQRLQNINLDNPDELWAALTDAEKQEFEALIKNGEIEKILPRWTPWWTYHVNRKLIQEIGEKSEEELKEYPPLIDVPIFNELQKASPSIHFNLVSVIYAYAYMANYYNGDYLNCPIEATVIFLDLCDNMKLNKNYETADAAITSVLHKIMNCNWFPQDDQTLTGFQEAGNFIMQGPERKNKYFYCAIAVSELYRLFTAAKEDLSKQKNKNTNKEFSKKFAQTYNMGNISLSKKTLLLHCKKLEYYLSWIKSYHVNAYT